LIGKEFVKLFAIIDLIPIYISFKIFFFLSGKTVIVEKL